MPRGEKLPRFAARLALQRFYGQVTIRFNSSKAAHVEINIRVAWQHKHLPEE